MGKSKSHPCRHPLKARQVLSEQVNTVIKVCKRCGKFWGEKLEAEPVKVIELGAKPTDYEILQAKVPDLLAFEEQKLAEEEAALARGAE